LLVNWLFLGRATFVMRWGGEQRRAVSPLHRSSLVPSSGFLLLLRKWALRGKGPSSRMQPTLEQRETWGWQRS